MAAILDFIIMQYSIAGIGRTDNGVFCDSYVYMLDGFKDLKCCSNSAETDKVLL